MADADKQALGFAHTLEVGSFDLKTNKPTPDDVIEDLGMGRWQLKAFLFGQGPIFFVMGATMKLFNAATVAVSLDLHVGATQRSLLCTFLLLGVLVGITPAGYLSDRYGRRLPTLVSLWIVGVFVCITGFMPRFFLIVMCGFVVGCGMGLGLPPSIAMVSENSPLKWRIPLRAISTAMYPLGSSVVIIIVIFDDPHFAHLHWRMLMFVVGASSLVLFFLAAVMLPESPVWLASQGRRAEALDGFGAIKTSNQSLNVNIQYENPVRNVSAIQSVRDKLKIIFSTRLLFSTVYCVYACFVVNLLQYGQMYASPQVFMSDGSHILPAVQDLYQLIPPFVGCGLISILAGSMSRKNLLLMNLTIGALAMLAIVCVGSTALPRSALMGILFELGVLGVPFASMSLFIVIYQVAVEIYPITASATGGAIIMGVGRIGSIIAPTLFETLTKATGSWHLFYYVVSAAVAVAAPMTLLFDPSQRYADEDSGLAENRDDGVGRYNTLERGA